MRSCFWVVSLLVICVFVTPRAKAEDIDLSNGHYPMIYVSTSETEAHFNVLVPRNKTYHFRAKGILGETVEGPIQDQQGLLHDHVLKVKFTGLTAATEYQLEISDVSKYGEEIVDRRVFSTFDHSRTDLTFAAGSCMSDEMRYEDARQKIAANMLRQNPDVILLDGDQVYVDAFDYVARHKVTELDVWMRYFRSFQVNPLFRSKRLVPTLTAWDDHDTGIDNGNMHTPTIAEARRAFQSLFGAPEIAGIAENGKNGLYRIVSIRGQNFVLLDNRSFRDEPDPNNRYGHIGKEQEEWLLEQLKSKKGFFWLVIGDMWGGKTETQVQKDGSVRRLTEGFYGDHPKQYTELMKAIHETGVPYGLISGDIHSTQIIEHGPEHRKTTRFAPFNTVEITSSPMFSFIFRERPGEEPLWKDPQRIAGIKEYNFVVVRTGAAPNGLDFAAASIGTEGNPFFSYGMRLDKEPTYRSARRRLLVRGKELKTKDKKIKVAFFDADSTLRISKSGRLSANNPLDVIILPGVANKIAELTKDGYLIAIVSNQGGIISKNVTFNQDNSYEGKFQIADQALKYTIRLIQKENPLAKIHYYDFAERGKGDFYTKPSVGMAKHLERVLAKKGFEIDWNNSFMVGDSDYTEDQISPRGRRGDASSPSDREFAENLNIRHIHPQDLLGWTDVQRKAIVNHDPKALLKTLHCELALSE